MTSERELKPCECADWKEGIKQIDGFITMGYIRGQKYTSKPFNYCPWCGLNRSPSQALEGEWPKKEKHHPDCKYYIGKNIDWCNCGAKDSNKMHAAFMAKIKNVRGK